MALQGTLETFALADVLRLLASTKKTGVLRIEGVRGYGDLMVVDGELADSSVTSAPRANRPAEVLFELLRYDDGTFVFDGDDALADRVGEERTQVDDALADAEEHLREWQEIEAVVPSPRRRISLVPEIHRSITLTPDQWGAVVALGRADCTEALGEELDMAELPAARLVRDMVQLGAVEVGEHDVSARRVAPAPAPAAVASSEPVVDLVASEPPPPPPAPAPAPEAAIEFEAPEPPSSIPPPPVDPPAAGSFASTPSFIGEPDDVPSGSSAEVSPLFGGTSTPEPSAAPSAFAPPSAAFAPAPHSDNGVAGWDDDPDDDALDSFHSDNDTVGLFRDASNDAPGPDDPFGPDPFQIPSFGTPADAKEAEEAAELARQLANLSPRAQQAVAAAAAANSDEERDQAIDRAEADADEPINRNLLLKYLSSVDE
ncbi:MAG: DUF4388 domain-containing protein [Acidimicrobiales bacterium]